MLHRAEGVRIPSFESEPVCDYDVPTPGHGNTTPFHLVLGTQLPYCEEAQRSSREEELRPPAHGALVEQPANSQHQLASRVKGSTSERIL